MSNIAIVNYCNLKCPYCFADNMIHQNNNRFISLNDYKNLIDFILKNPYDQIGIIGGEPTLHPNFKELIYITKQKSQGRKILLFTNGIELQKFLPDLENIDILINYNNPCNMTKNQFLKLNNCLDEIFKLGLFNKTVNIGCNIYLDCYNYDYIWDIVKKYQLKIIRCSVVSPGGIYQSWRSKKDEYFNILKSQFLTFCQEALDNNCKLSIDCGHIPFCYFTDDELKLINKICKLDHCFDFCPAILDFTTDLKVTTCFGVYNPIDFSKFTNTQSLATYLFQKQNKKLAKLNNQGKCSTCEAHKNGSCQGGCLAFSSPE